MRIALMRDCKFRDLLYLRQCSKFDYIQIYRLLPVLKNNREIISLNFIKLTKYCNKCQTISVLNSNSFVSSLLQNCYTANISVRSCIVVISYS